MADNLTLHRSPDYTKPVVEMKPAAFDLVVKVIRMSGLSHVYIAESVLHGLIQNNDKEAERLFHIIQSDFSKIIGNGVNLNFSLTPEIKKALLSIKSNYNTVIYDQDSGHYFFTNGECNFLLPKIDPQDISTLIPNFNGGMKKETQKCKQIKAAMGKSKYVDILIFNNSINSILIPNTNSIISLEPLSTAELMKKAPDMILRAFHFLGITANEAIFIINHSNGVYWLDTIINISTDVRMEQFQPLKQIK